MDLSAVGAIADAASGGVLGLVGSVVGVGARHVQAKAEHKRRLAEQAHELALLDRQRAAAEQETESEIALAAAAGSWDGLRASIAHDTAAGAAPALPVWVQSARALMRPALTVGLLAAVLMLWRSLPDTLPPAEAASTGEHLARALVSAATTAVVWWFGDRSLAAPADKRR